jgi:hypothetical protein
MFRRRPAATQNYVGGSIGMSLFTHLETLEEKHTRLEGLLASETLRPMPDFSRIQTLKKQKLLVKEEIEGDVA